MPVGSRARRTHSLPLRMRRRCDRRDRRSPPDATRQWSPFRPACSHTSTSWTLPVSPQAPAPDAPLGAPHGRAAPGSLGWPDASRWRREQALVIPHCGPAPTLARPLRPSSPKPAKSRPHRRGGGKQGTGTVAIIAPGGSRVPTSLTPVGHAADSPASLLRPSPATGHAAKMLDV
jgi:hypothetical protein